MSKPIKTVARLAKRSTVPFVVATSQVADGQPVDIEFSCVGNHLSRAELDELTAKQNDGELSNAEIVQQHVISFAGFQDENGDAADSDTIKAYVLDDAGLCLAVTRAYIKRLLGVVEGNSPKSRRA
jgi:hypothetical protein